MDITELTKDGQELTKQGAIKQRHYRGLERRDFNIRMQVTISGLHDEMCRMEKIKSWYSTLYRANNSIVLHQFETS